MREEKQLLLDEVKDNIKEREDFALFQYSQINANSMANFRTNIAKIGGDVQIVRKRIFVKAAQAAGIDFDLESLPGHIGLVYSGSDPIEMTKAVCQYSKDSGSALQVLAGRLDGRFYSGEDVEALSKLPGKDEMRAQFLGLLEAPMSQTVGVMNSLLAAVPCCLENKSKQES